MYEQKFSEWIKWSSRLELDGLNFPGVYVLAISPTTLIGEVFSWREEIVYVGMTNASLGLKGRLKQFDNTIAGKSGHGGAERVRFKHSDYAKLTKRLYVAVAAFKCNPKSAEPSVLKIKGQVAKFEYLCFAEFAKFFGQVPEFNRSSSPKKIQS